MQYLDLTCPTPAENLALDEALLEEAEAAAFPRETLRLWESPVPMVVIGRSSHIQTETQIDNCRSLGIPILRRISGGASIVVGPGCLMYALVLSYQHRPLLRAINEAHRIILATIAAALSSLVPGVRCRGTSDLTIDSPCTTAGLPNNPVNTSQHPCPAEQPSTLALKFSGNSVRCRRNYLLYHGSLLYDFPLNLIEQCLAMPPKMPDYREGRAHTRFVTNLPTTAEAMRIALRAAWNADEVRTDWPAERTAQLVQSKYSLPEWNA